MSVVDAAHEMCAVSRAAAVTGRFASRRRANFDAQAAAASGVSDQGSLLGDHAS